ncbi:MAG: acyltransferase [Lachnospiraceae bacterium]|nr:acyltransferase [Lachnospiraceae bacterium]
MSDRPKENTHRESTHREHVQKEASHREAVCHEHRHRDPMRNDVAPGGPKHREHPNKEHIHRDHHKMDSSEIDIVNNEDISRTKKALKQSKKKKTEKSENNREIYFDILRIVAIIFVIICHTEGAELFGQCEPGSLLYGLFIMFSIMGSTGPLILFMILGALLLPKEESLSVLWKKRILRIFSVLFVFTLLYYISDVIAGRDEINVFTFLGDLYAKERVEPLWFMYSYLGMLICLPFLRPMAQNMKDRDFIYLLSMAAILEVVLPEIEEKVFLGRFTLNISFYLGWILTKIVLYPLAGYYIHNRLKREHAVKILPIVWVVNIIVMILIACNTAYYTTYVESIKIYTDYFGWGLYINTLALFLTAKVLFEGKVYGDTTVKVLSSIAGCTFGIYLIHPAVLDRIVFFGKVKDSIFGNITGPAMFWPELLWIVVIFVTCLIPTWLIRRIPFMRKWL